MPTEVFDYFLKPIINDIGWPFQSIFSPLAGTDWYRILHPLTLVCLSQLKWVRREFILEKEVFYPSSLADIGYVIANKTKDIWAFVGRDSQPCRDSLLWHEKFITKTGRLSAPVTMVFTTEGFKILDGNHRIASLFTLGIIDTFKVDAWVGVSLETVKAMSDV